MLKFISILGLKLYICIHFNQCTMSYLFTQDRELNDSPEAVQELTGNQQEALDRAKAFADWLTNLGVEASAKLDEHAYIFIGGESCKIDHTGRFLGAGGCDALYHIFCTYGDRLKS